MYVCRHCVCTCVACTYVCRQMYAHVCMSVTCTHAYVYAHVLVQMHVCTCVYECGAHTCMYVHLCVHYECTHVFCVHVCVQMSLACMHTYMCVCTCGSVFTCEGWYVRVWACNPNLYKLNEAFYTSVSSGENSV